MTSTISGGTSALNRSSPLPPVFTAEEPPATVNIGRFWKPVHDWTSFSMAILCFSLHLCEVFGHCQVQMLVTTSVISLLPLSLTLIVPEGVKVRPVGKIHVPMVGLALDALAARHVALLYNDLTHLPWRFTLAPAATTSTPR